MAIKILVLKFRYRSLVGLQFPLWFRENGREFQQMQIVRSQYSKNQYWTSPLGINNYAGHSGDWIRKCLSEKVVVDMDNVNYETDEHPSLRKLAVTFLKWLLTNLERCG